MEQLRQLGGRLLGKKCVAVILGLLGLCGPSSLWAEKLDTTFVLDMVIDSTPCYFTQYNDKGQIIQYDIYHSSSFYSSLSIRGYALIDDDDFSHINIGYITDMTGERVDTIYYIRDKVTKQWREKKDFPNCMGYSPDEIELRFYNNGMLESINVSKSFTSFMSGHVEFSESGELKEYSNGYQLYDTWDINDDYRMNCDSFGNINLEYRLNSSSHKGGVAESSSFYSKTIYKNQYDTKYNLIEAEGIIEYRDSESSFAPYSSNYDVKGTSRRKMEHSYDSQNRRIKTITYNYIDSNYVLIDSTIYSYGHALHEGEACLLSVLVSDNPIDSFSPDKYHYDFPNVVCGDLKYITPYGSAVEESYNAQTSTLSVTIKGSDGHVNTYTFTLKKSESFMTALSPDSVLSIDFSPEKYQYDELENFHISYFEFYRLGYTRNYFTINSDDTLKNGEKSARVYFDVSEDARATYSYDARNGIFTITVTGSDVTKNPDNKHTYTFKTKKAYISSLRYNEKEFEGLSPDVYDYEMPADAKLSDISIRRFEVETYPEYLYTRKEYSHSTHTMYITLLAMYEYSGNADTLAVYQFHYKPDIRIVYDYIDSCMNRLEGFSENVFEYEMTGKYYPGRLKYTVRYTMDSINIDESFDEQTNILTVSASFKNDSIRVTNYRFHFPEGSEEIIPPTLYISTKGGNALDGIIVDNTEYEVIGFFYSSFCQCEVVDGKVMSMSYDESTNVWTIIVTDVFGSNRTTYHIHFKHPSFSSFTIKGEPLDTFSADTYDYLFDMEYDSSTVSYELPDDVDATESFNKTTNILTIRLTPRKTDGTVEYKFHFRPVDGVDDFLGDQVKLYVTGKTICVDGATEPISVYDLLGTLVGISRSEEARIPVSQAGVYVVKAGGKAAKVVVK